MQAKLLPRHVTMLALLVTGLAGGLSSPATADTIAVPGDAPTIQIALNISVNGDEIVVAPGTYFEALDFGNPPRVITLRSSGGPDVTTISGLGQIFSTIRIVGDNAGEAGFTPLIEGFTISGADLTLPSAVDDRGAGLYVQDASPTIRDCVFEMNLAPLGAGIYVESGTPTIEDCRFELNEADQGAGLYLRNSTSMVTGSTFTRNDAIDATARGGGMRTNGGSVTVSDCTFVENTALNPAGITHGGAMDNDSTNATVERCRFFANLSDRGGAMSNKGAGTVVTVSNSIFSGNQAFNISQGGAIYSLSGPNVTLTNCTLTQNSASDGGGTWTSLTNTTSLINCIIYGNSGGAFGGVLLNTTAAYCNYEGGSGTNIDADPMFMDANGADNVPGTEDDDLHLRHELPENVSPSIDAGDTEVLGGANPVDLDGAARAVDDPDTPDTGVSFLNLAVDMGAYELQPAPVPPSCPEDINGDGAINVLDLIEVLLAFGTTCP